MKLKSIDYFDLEVTSIKGEKMIKSGRLLRSIIPVMAMFSVSGFANAELSHKVVNKGLVAQFSGGNSSSGYIDVFLTQSGLGAAQTTTLYYSVSKGVEYKSWSGVIPNSAISGSGTGNLTVNYNTCSVNPVALCGVINVSWKKNNTHSQFKSGLSISKFQSVIMQSHGTRTQNTTDSAGSVLDTNLSVIPHLSSYMGVDHNVTHTISRNLD